MLLSLQNFECHRLNFVQQNSRAIHKTHYWIPLELLRNSGNDDGI